MRWLSLELLRREQFALPTSELPLDLHDPYLELYSVYDASAGHTINPEFSLCQLLAPGDQEIAPMLCEYS